MACLSLAAIACQAEPTYLSTPLTVRNNVEQVREELARGDRLSPAEEQSIRWQCNEHPIPACNELLGQLALSSNSWDAEAASRRGRRGARSVTSQIGRR